MEIGGGGKGKVIEKVEDRERWFEWRKRTDDVGDIGEIIFGDCNGGLTRVKGELRKVMNFTERMEEKTLREIWVVIRWIDSNWNRVVK